MKKKVKITNKTKFLFTLFLLFLMAIPWNAQSQIQVNKQTTRQEIWGFGAAAEHTVRQLKNNTSAANQKLILDKLFRTDNDNAGLSIIRYEISSFKKGENDPTGSERYTIEPSDGVWDWETDQTQRWFAQEAINRNPDVKMIAVPWSPPSWMKTNGSCINGGNLKGEVYDKFATYMKTWVDHYRNVYGFDIQWISIQNEPSNNTPYASCIYDPNSLGIVTAKVADAVHSLNQGVLVGSPEAWGRNESDKFMGGMSAEAKSKMDFCVTHDYGGANGVLQKYGKPVINTEIWSEGGNDLSIGDGIRWANEIKDALNRNEAGWLFWWMCDPYDAGAQGLVHLTNGGFEIPKRLYTIGQFSRFIKHGDKRVDVTASNGLGVIATKNAAGNATIVVINGGGAVTTTVNGLSSQLLSVYRTSGGENIAKQADINIVGGSATVTFAGNSVTTLVESGPVCNNLPTISAITDKTFDVTDGVQTIAMAGISDGDGCTQGITSVTAVSSNPLVVSVGTVNYTSCNTTGTLSITPVNKGTATITVTVKDAGKIDCPSASTSITFTVNVAGTLQLPAKIEAENYDAMLGIQTEATTDAGGGLDVGYTDPTDYIEFFVNVPYTGSYNIDFRVASQVNTGAINITSSLSGATSLGTLALPTTGGWQNWVTKTVNNVNLKAGKQTLRITWTGAGMNINWLEVKSNRILTTIAVVCSTYLEEVNEGQTLQYSAIGKDQFGVVMPINPVWTVSGGGTISQSGLFSATTKGGPYTITASVGNVSGIGHVTVLHFSVLKTINVTPLSSKLYTGQSQQYTAVGIDQFGDVFKFWSPPIWSVTGGGTISETGLFTATNEGGPFTVTATIIEAYNPDISGTAQVTVEQLPVLTTITLTQVAPTVYVGEPSQITAVGRDQNGNVMPIAPVWTSTCWQISQSGEVRCSTPGVCNVCATVGDVSQCITITAIVAPVLTTVEITPAKLRITEGQTQQYTAVGKDQYGAIMPISTTWEVVEGGGNIDRQTGLYTATTPGGPYSIIVACPGSDYYYIYGYAEVTVDPKVLTTIEVTPSIATVKVGQGIQYKATCKDQNGNVMPIVPVWLVTEGGIIDRLTGLFTATTAGGPFTVSAVVDDEDPNTIVTGTAQVTVEPMVSIVIQAENYINMNGIQKETTTDEGGGQNVGWVDNGDWMTYSVNIPVSGIYSANFRVAGWAATGKIELQNAANAKLTGINVPNNGGYQKWSTVAGETSFYLAAGIQTIRVFANGAPWNLNWFELKLVTPSTLSSIAVTPSPVTVVKGSTQQFTAVGKDQFGNVMPINPAPVWSTAASCSVSASGLFTAGITIGTVYVTVQSGLAVATVTVSIIDIQLTNHIEAENYSAMQGIQKEPCTDLGGGQDVGYVDPNDWLDYPVTIPSSGVYTISFRLACALGTGSFQLKSGANVLASVTVPNTGGWQNWQTVNVTANLTAGAQTLRIAFTGIGCNINWWEYTQGLKSAEEFSAVTADFNVFPNPATDMVTIEANNADFNVVEIHSITGALMISEPILGPVTEINLSELNNGLYLISLKGNSISTKKLIKQ
jgi:glucuronoarabinoxylan endo-1,4-beta-xylanase